MGIRRETIMYVSQDAQSENIIIWAKSFRAEGKLFTDKEGFERNVVTLMDAHICSPYEKCSCEGRSAIKWLNIFEDEIISFSISKD